MAIKGKDKKRLIYAVAVAALLWSLRAFVNSIYMLLKGDSPADVDEKDKVEGLKVEMGNIKFPEEHYQAASDKLHLAFLAFWGTDEETIFEVLGNLNRDEINLVRKKFGVKSNIPWIIGKAPLSVWISAEFSGDAETALVNYVSDYGTRAQQIKDFAREREKDSWL